MKIQRWLLLITFVWGPALAESHEDPAILVCEFILKNRLKTPKSYERVDAKIMLNRVHLVFDAVNVFNAPLRDTYDCAFATMKDGRWTLTTAQEDTEFSAISEAIKRSKLNGMTEEDKSKLQARIDAAQKHALDAAFAAMQDVIVAQKLPYFPIDPQDTRLAPAGKE